MANGMAGKMPAIPLGRKLEPPSSGGMLVHRLVSSLPDTSTEMKRRQDPQGEDVDHTVNRIVASMPMMLMATKTT